jgi:hypothetical protein
MARVTQPRFDNLVRRLFGVRRPVLDSVLGDVFPTFDVQSPRVDQGFLRHEWPLGFGISLAAVVGQQGFLRITNPAGSGKILTIDRVRLAGTAVSWSWGLDNTPAVGGTASMERDTRLRGRTFASLLTSGTTAANTLLTTPGAWGSVTGDTKIAQVLTPGFTWGIYSGALNTLVIIDVDWTEREVQPEELIA